MHVSTEAQWCPPNYAEATDVSIQTLSLHSKLLMELGL